MYARVTPFKMKAGTKDTATALMQKAKEDILSLPGMVQFINVMNDDGSGYVVALSTNAESAPETVEKIQAIWSAFSDLLESKPEAGNFEVIADWKP